MTSTYDSDLKDLASEYLNVTLTLEEKKNPSIYTIIYNNIFHGQNNQQPVHSGSQRRKKNGSPTQRGRSHLIGR